MSVPATSAQRYARLTDINIDDMLRAIGQNSNPAFRRLFRPHAQRFTRMLMQYDATVGRRGMAAGSRFVLNQFNANVTVHGAPHMDTTRPTLYLANHPGLTDTVSLFAKLPRPDYKIIAGTNPFLACLPNVSQQLLTVDLSNRNNGDNFAPLRGAISHLKQGGALVTFPAGKIEPDPAVADGAVESLDSWVNMDVFGRLVPDCIIVPILIAGVFNGRARHHPFVRLRQKADDQAWSAAILQLTFPDRYPVTPQIHVGEPIDLCKYPRRTPISPLIRTRMEQLIVLNYPHETRQAGIRLLTT